MADCSAGAPSQAPGVAPAGRPVAIDDFCRYRYVNSVRVAPDGRRLVCSVITADLGENRYGNDLWTLDPGTGAARRLTSSGREGAFEFTDGGDVVFVSGRRKGGPAGGAGGQGRGQERGRAGSQADACALARDKGQRELAGEESLGTDLYRIPLDGGEASLLAHLPLDVLDWRQLPQGRLLVRARELRDPSSPYAALDEIPFCENGGSLMSGLRAGLYVVEPAEARPGAPAGEAGEPAVRRVTAEGQSVDDYDLSADRSCAFALASAYEGRMPLRNRLVRIDLATGAQEPLGPEGMAFSAVRLLEEGRLVLLGSDLLAFGINEDPQAYAMGTDGSGFRRLSPEGFDVDFYNHITTDARQGGGRTLLARGGALYFAHADGDASHLSRLGPDGRVELLVGGEGSLDCFDTLDGRELFYVAMRPGMLPEVYRAAAGGAEPGGASAEERLTRFTEEGLGGASVQEPESFDFESNGDTLRGYVVRPAGYVPGRRYPGVLWVHGGPKCVMGDVFHHEIQFLSGLGYFVFYTNPHGSGGHGMEYAASIFGGYGGKDFQDLMAFTDEVLRRYPDVDAGRLAETGGSYGGFMTNWVAGHTDRFACLVSQRSISNWVSMFGTSDIGYYFADDQTRGWIWDGDGAEDSSVGAFLDPAPGCGEEGRDGAARVRAMWDQSPLKYADRVRTPVLFLHSDCDYRCPLEQGMQMFTALKVHGVPSRMVVFKGENHELSRSGKPRARVRRLAEMADWLARWLKDEPDGEPALREQAASGPASR